MDTISAMTEAMVKAFSAVASSSITTIMGFAVMMLMQFKIGYDMGIVLAKDIFISLITTMVLLPAITILVTPAIEKTHHRSFLPKMDGFGRLNARLCIPVALLVAVLVIGPAYLGSRSNRFLYGASEMITDPRLPSRSG